VSQPETILGSLARISDFASRPPEIKPLPRDNWSRGDYIMVEMLDTGLESYTVETPDGSPAEMHPGDRLIGALGTRAATLEVVGDWREIGEDLQMQTLTAAGVLGVCTSAAFDSSPLADVRYVGHAFHGEERCTMKGFVEPGGHAVRTVPVILIIGTSMESGKTIAAVAMIRELAAMGKRVAGAKVTGVGRLRDILAMKKAGAETIMDFVDVGLPSTVTPREEYESCLKDLIARLAETEPDVMIIEAGASPLEPYRGDVAMEALQPRVEATVLCASDPYAVLGVTEAFGRKPELVAGRATGTEAGRDLIDKLVGVPALNLIDPATGPELADYLREWLDF